MSATPADMRDIAQQVVGALTERRSIAPFTDRFPDLTIAQAYAVTAEVRRLRQARGEVPIGRKIGFTNRSIWPEYGVDMPIWGDMYDTTVHETGDGLSLAPFVEPRIEPEIIFKLAKPPQPGMDEAALLGCMTWVAHGFEIVNSLFPGWRFKAADTIAGLGLHGALMIGTPLRVGGLHDENLLEALRTFEVTLARDGVDVDRGAAADVLDGPLSALRHLVDLLAADPGNPPLRAGEIVTTGTITRAFPCAAGETWTTAISGITLPSLAVTFG